MITALNIAKLRLDMGEYVLSVAGLHKRSGGRKILAGVDLDVKRGAITALVGPAGAGKSATLACIAGALRPNAGRIRYFGYEIGGRGEARVTRMGVVRVTQSAEIFPGLSVLDSVMVGALLRRASPTRARVHAREILDLVQLPSRSTTAAEHLEHAQRWRLGLAQACATDPQLVLLDDIGNDVNADGMTDRVAVLRALHARGVTIVATGRTRDCFAHWVDEIVEIDCGTTSRLGTTVPLDLLA